MRKSGFTALVSISMIGLFLLASVTYQSCGKKKVKQTDINDELEGVSDKHNPDEEFEGGYTFNTDGSDPTAANPEAAASGATSATYSAGTPTSITSIPSTNYSSSSSSSAPFLVVAGNYLLEDNATAMVRKLREKGHNGAEKVIFDLSQYHTVIAGRFATQSAAKSVSTELKSAGIDNYILKK